MNTREPLRELIAKWRRCIGVRDLTGDYYGEDYAKCADELEAALAAPEQATNGYTLIPDSALRWLFGEEGDFVAPIEAGDRNKLPRAFWWRSEFRKRIALIQPSKEKLPVPAPAAEAGTPLSFETFSRINRQRCEAPTGFNHQLSSWSTSDWFLALLGELGEAANIAKKLNRVRDGIPGNKFSEDELRTKLRQEVGDTFVYLDLLCQACGISVCAAAIEVFNAKSRELGCPIVMDNSIYKEVDNC